MTSDDPVVVDEALLLIGKRDAGELESEVWKFLDNDGAGLQQRAAAPLGAYLQVPEFSRLSPLKRKADPDPFVRASALGSAK
jgi:hypothetical protein